MRLLLVFFASILPLNSLVSGLSGGPARHSRLARNVHAHRNFTLQDYFTGYDFLYEWNYFTGEDPNGGNVQFLSREDAIDKKLIYVQPDGTTVLAVDDYSDVPVGGKRNSVRIQSNKRYNGGLFIADFFAMPHGCSVWPAYWLTSDIHEWPTAGELDIIENVNNATTNEYTLHTPEFTGCTSSTAGKPIRSGVINKICDTSLADPDGCGYLDSSASSFGHGFNMNAGGVFALLWERTGISVWQFDRECIPPDITARNPNPASWSTPAAVWSSETCDIDKAIFDQVLILETSICGSYCKAMYQHTCPGTCEEAVAKKKNFRFAKWMINYVAVYD